MSDPYYKQYYNQYGPPHPGYGQQNIEYNNGGYSGYYPSQESQYGQPPQYTNNPPTPPYHPYSTQSAQAALPYTQQGPAPPYDERKHQGGYEDGKIAQEMVGQSSSYPQPPPYQQGANASYYSTQSAPPDTKAVEGERGFISTVAGAAGGGLLGRRLGGGMLGAAGGAVAGAAGMNLASKM
ncbi:hypothetical protein BO71DRAFT_451559 [Aspergillus ellipticus CBS 707.79]|uniref:Glycine zipper 2TM domain-containing protein n=1 Tax=Aspergillus ellipticus CBS 707.79 TaxID=1448320 RepID=A0A319DD72_9EURO|nr:hypothetical protein BO71DRAFT_451559 [Aspergillus ellipticus CBS 707.79]